MKKFLSLLKWNIKNTIHYFTQRPHPGKAGKTVYLDFTYNNWDRYLGILLLFFHIRKYNIIIKYNFGFWGSWSTSLFFLFQLPFKLVLSKPSRFDIGLTTKPNEPDMLQVHHNYFNSENNSHCFHIPMPMVDTMYTKGYYKEEVVENAGDNRKIKVFFAGRFHEKNYSNAIVKEKFNIIARQDLLSIIMNYPGEKYRIIKSENELFDNNENKIVLVNRDIYNIPAKNLRGVLSQTDFFIAFPGVVMPLCHNIIEAMSAGSIPILQYKEYMHPNLMHEVNCLAFKDENDLENILHLAIQMSSDKVNQMRENVISYYNQYLKVESVINSLQNVYDENPGKTLLLNAEFQSVKIMKLER
jgi:hypothetical protein